MDNRTIIRSRLGHLMVSLLLDLPAPLGWHDHPSPTLRGVAIVCLLLSAAHTAHQVLWANTGPR